MLRIETQRYPYVNGSRAEVVSSVVGACDLCGTVCEASRQWDDTQWDQGLAHESAKSAGYREQYSGRVRQLVCPKCQEIDHA